jgi:hypothetical protein
MSQTLILDMEQTMTWDCFRSIVVAMNVFIAEENRDMGEDIPNNITGVFPNSKRSFVAAEYKIPKKVHVENYFGELWSKKISVYVNMGTKDFEPDDEVVVLLKKIIKASPAAFVVSYDYSRLYTQRSQNQPNYDVTEESPWWLRESSV